MEQTEKARNAARTYRMRKQRNRPRRGYILFQHSRASQRIVLRMVDDWVTVDYEKKWYLGCIVEVGFEGPFIFVGKKKIN